MIKLGQRALINLKCNNEINVTTRLGTKTFDLCGNRTTSNTQSTLHQGFKIREQRLEEVEL